MYNEGRNVKQGEGAMEFSEKPYEGYIGVYDSGVGGISVLKEIVKVLPEENIFFFGDSANAPYGEKPTDEILTLSMRIADRMVKEGCKAIVIACNTATSASAKEIRDKYEDRMPIIGVEPAIKPAALAKEGSRVLVMATPATLRLEKFQKLEEKLESRAEFIPVACPGLALRIEQGDLDAPDLLELLEVLIGSYRGKVDSIVLGCTHYPFVKKAIRQIMGDIPIFESGEGTARNLRANLEARSVLKDDGAPGKVIFGSSKTNPEEIELYERFFRNDDF